MRHWCQTYASVAMVHTTRITRHNITVTLEHCWISVLVQGQSIVGKAWNCRLGAHRYWQCGNHSRSSPLASAAPTGASIEFRCWTTSCSQSGSSMRYSAEINQEVSGGEELTLELSGIAHRHRVWLFVCSAMRRAAKEFGLNCFDLVYLQAPLARSKPLRLPLWARAF